MVSTPIPAITIVWGERMTFPHNLDTTGQNSLDRLILAFAVAATREIVAADGILDSDELRTLAQWFPDRLLQQFALADEDGKLNAAFARAREEALQVLPERLTLKQKLEVLALLHRMTVIDGELHELEFDVLQRAAAALQVAPSILARHLSVLPESSSAPPPVRRPA
jgi:uncharacterized tellurite resistance protein B-like protein